MAHIAINSKRILVFLDAVITTNKYTGIFINCQIIYVYKESEYILKIIQNLYDILVINLTEKNNNQLQLL